MLTLIEYNSKTERLEITSGNSLEDIKNPNNKMIMSYELFSELMESSIFHNWLETMNLKIERKQQ